MNALCLLSAHEQARLIREKQVSALDVVDAHIARIEEVNPRLNAIVAERFEMARKEARRALPSTPPPLWGVPCSIKEFIAVEGLPSTCGALSLKNRISKRDALVVERVREAGAIVLGVSNVPEWGLWFESFNPVYGRTLNPWDTERTSGGSSGGESAIIAACGTAFGLGSDIGGSIRMPSAFCGLFGHKPTEKTVPLRGHFPYDSSNEVREGLDFPVLGIGPLARSALDLRLVLELIIGSALPVASRPKRIYQLPNPQALLVSSTDESLQKATCEAAKALAEATGAELVELDSKYFASAPDCWAQAMSELDGMDLRQILSNGKGMSNMDVVSEVAGELWQAMLGRPTEHSWPVLLTLSGEKFFAPERGSERFERNRKIRLELQKDLEEKLRDSVLVMPVFPTVAPRHNRPLMRPFDFAFAGIMNALGVPATAVPTGFDESSRMPLGVQIVSARGNDSLTLSAAETLQKHFAPKLRFGGIL